MHPLAEERSSHGPSWLSEAAGVARSGDRRRAPCRPPSRAATIEAGTVKRSNSERTERTLQDWVAAVAGFLNGDAPQETPPSSLSTPERTSDASLRSPQQPQHQGPQLQQRMPAQVSSSCSGSGVPPDYQQLQQSKQSAINTGSEPCLCSMSSYPVSDAASTSGCPPPRMAATRSRLHDVIATASTRLASGRVTHAPNSQGSSELLCGAYSSDEDETEEVTRQLTAAFPSLRSRTSCETRNWSLYARLQPQGMSASEPTTPRLLSQRSTDTGSEDLTPEEVQVLEQRRQRRNNSHLTTGDAAVELFLRLNHAKQTLEYSRRQAVLLSSTHRARMTVWEALDRLDELREYEAALRSEAGAPHLDPSMSLKEHALQTAELCRLAHPELDWLPLVGLIHGLGKLMAHPLFGSQPQWSVCGETYPLGCRFDPQIEGAQFFSANPDRRRRLFTASQTGMYSPGCGLLHVAMSWSAAEMLYLTLLLNNTALPHEALFVLRHQKFYSVTRPSGSPYQQLLSEADRSMLPLLASFQKLAAYRRVALPAESTLQGQAQRDYYDTLLQKYQLDKELAW